MDMKLVFQEAAGFQTPLLAVFAVDVAIGEGCRSSDCLVTTSDRSGQCSGDDDRIG